MALPRKPLLALAGRSVRAAAEAARRDGFAVWALDLFGDVDTRRACNGWQRIGDPAALRIDAVALRNALARAAADGAMGWIAGSGFDDMPELLDAGGAALPLLGTAATSQRRLRDPREFFALLDAQQLPHPAVAWHLPGDADGRWLVKDAGGSGGDHVRWPEPGERELPPRHYAQQHVAGLAMSATFIAEVGGARLLGCNRLLQRPRPARPWQFSGAVGPVTLPAAASATLQRALQVLSMAFDLRGLGSLDFVFDGCQPQLLEVNARIPATIALYAAQAPVAGHVAACLGQPVAAVPAPAATDPVHAFETLCARGGGPVGAWRAAALAALAGVHDLPHAGDVLPDGAPLCTVSAAGASAEQALVRLARRARQIDCAVSHL